MEVFLICVCVRLTFQKRPEQVHISFFFFPAPRCQHCIHSDRGATRTRGPHPRMALVLVQHCFEYTAKDGRLVSIKPDESYILVSKTNQHWWHVRKEQHTRPFYVPAQYVKELPSPAADSTGPESAADCKPVDVATPVSARETYRFSTFGFCEDISDAKPCESLKGETPSSFARIVDAAHVSTGRSPFDSGPVENDDLQLYARPHPVPKAGRRGEQAKRSPQDVTERPPFLHNEDLDFPLPPDLAIYEVIPELPEPGGSNGTLMFEQQDFSRTAEATSPADVPSAEQVRGFSCKAQLFHQ